MTTHLTKEDYPFAYYLVKVVAGLITLWGAILVIDWYIPGEITSTPVVDMYIKPSTSGFDPSFFIITSRDTFSVKPDMFNQIKKGMTIRKDKSRFLGIDKQMELQINPYQTERLRLDNIFMLNGFFPKFLLLSIFAFLFARPSVWMIGVTALNMVVVLVFSGLPMGLMFAIAFVLAVIIGIYRVYTYRKT